MLRYHQPRRGGAAGSTLVAVGVSSFSLSSRLVSSRESFELRLKDILEGHEVSLHKLSDKELIKKNRSNSPK